MNENTSKISRKIILPRITQHPTKVNTQNNALSLYPSEVVKCLKNCRENKEIFISVP